MSNPPEHNTEEHSTPAPKASTFVITRALFDQVPVYRARYILLYVATLLWWVATRVMMLITKTEPSPAVVVASLVLLTVLYLAFYFNFVKTMRILGWPWWWIVPSILVCSIPFLGVLPMGITDRRIADQWDKADDEHTRYRERVYAEDSEADDEEA